MVRNLRHTNRIPDKEGLKARIEEVKGEAAKRGRANDIEDGLIPDDTEATGETPPPSN